MVEINKQEAELIQKEFPEIKISKSCTLKNNGKQRGKKYAPESPAILAFLANLRK